MNIKQVINSMDNWLEDNYPHVIAEKIDGDNLATMCDIEDGSYIQAAHLKWMIGVMKELDRYALKNTEIREKLMRWIGFMQGALWSLGLASIDEFREINTDG